MYQRTKAKKQAPMPPMPGGGQMGFEQTHS